jgi:hypothetical protein
MNILTTFLLTSALAMLRKLATQQLFEHIVISVAEAGVKSTKTTWDDELVGKIKAALGK